VAPGKVKFFGTERECVEKGEDQFENGIFFESGQEGSEDERVPTATTTKTKNNKKPQTKLYIENEKFEKLKRAYGAPPDDDINEIASEQPPSNSKIEITPKHMLQSKNHQSTEPPNSATQSPTHSFDHHASAKQTTPPFTTQDWIQNDPFTQTQPINNDNNDKIDTLLTILNNVARELAATRQDAATCKEILRKISSKKGYDKDYPTELMHNGDNLLDIPFRKKNKFITAVMAMLFTQDELIDGIIIDEAGKKSEHSVLHLILSVSKSYVKHAISNFVHQMT
jgi:hypothetical protein